MWAVSFSLSLLVYLPLPSKSLETLLRPSVRPPLLHVSSALGTNRVFLVQGFEGMFAPGLHICHLKRPCSVSPPSPVGVRWALRAPLKQRQSHFWPALPRCPCVPPRPHSRHTHGFDNKERAKERVKAMVKEKHWGSLLPVSFTTELWLSSQESVPLLHNKREIMEWETEAARGGASLFPPLLLPLWRSFLLLWFKKEKNTFEASATTELFHFFLLSLAEFRSWGQRACPSADGLYFDYGALVVMGDGRRGGAKGCVCAYKRLALKLQKAWSSHGPGRSAHWQNNSERSSDWITEPRLRFWWSNLQLLD